MLSAIASGVPFPLMGILFGQLVDDLNSASCTAAANGPADAASRHRSMAAVDGRVLDVVYIGIAYLALVYIYVFCWCLSGERLAQRLRDKYLATLLTQDAGFVDSLPAGAAAARLTDDINLVRNGTSEKVGIALNAISFFITAYIVAFIKDARLAGELVSLWPAFMLMSLVGGALVQRYAAIVAARVSAATSVALEALAHMPVVQLFGAAGRLEAHFAAALRDARRAGINKALAAAVQAGLLYFIAYSGSALAFWQGSISIAKAVAGSRHGQTVGTTYTVIFILVDATLVLAIVAPFMQIFDQAAVAFDRLAADIERPSRIDGTAAAGTRLPSVRGDVALDAVRFAYPARPDKVVLPSLTFNCPAGQTTALVGQSGSGKSTIAALLLRLYDPAAGAVTLDGVDLRELNVRWLRGLIGLVQQDPALLDRSILENVALGLVNSPVHAHLHDLILSPSIAALAADIRAAPTATAAVTASSYGPAMVELVGLVEHALRTADAWPFVSRLRQGLGTPVGASGGALLSGGQKQRISIARALVKDPPILVLDEATASLDSASEMRVQAAIEAAAADRGPDKPPRTVIVIAHRLATVRNADNIIVLRDGIIQESGTHDDLLARDGAYAALVRLQRIDKDDASAAESDASVSASVSGKGSTPDDERLHASSPEAKAAPVLLVGETDEQAEPDADPDGGGGEKSDGGKKKKAAKDDDDADLTGIGSRSARATLADAGHLFRPYTIILVAALVASVVVGGAFSANAVIFGNTIGDLSPCRGPARIRHAGRFYGLMFFVLALAEFAANFVSWALFGLVSERVIYTVRVRSFRVLAGQDVQWHQSSGRSPSALLSLVTRDGNALAGLTGSVAGSVTSIIANFLSAIILAHAIAWKIAVVCLAVVPLMVGAGVMRVLSCVRFEIRHAAAFQRSVGIAIEAVDRLRIIAALGLEREVVGVYRRSLAGPARDTVRMAALTNLWLAIAYGLSNFLYALAYWWGARQIVDGRYSQKQFFIVLMAMLVSAQLWGQMFSLAPDVSKAFGAIGRLLNLLDLGEQPGRDLEDGAGRENDPDRENESGDGPSSAAPIPLSPLPAAPRPGMSVSFTGVHFAYPARPSVPVLRGLDLSIRPGQFAAFVGPSGAGKSTVLSLVSRLFTASAGRVAVDGVDVGRLSRAEYTRMLGDDVALVPQEPALFEGSVQFNVALGRRLYSGGNSGDSGDRDKNNNSGKKGSSAADADIEAACRAAHIHSTIVSFPAGYATPCGRAGGAHLSGGQRQRLALARALVRRPRLLLLDESTSALDAETEAGVRASVDALVRDARGGVTVVAIAHRLATIRRADVIFLVADGRCVDRGTHTELLARSEVYRASVVHQAMGE